MKPVLNPSRQHCWHVILLLGLMLLAGCDHLRERTAEEPADWQARAARLATIDSWYLQARLGVRSVDQGGSLDVYWNQQGEQYQLRLLAALGQGAFFISGDAGSVSLRTAEGDVRTAATAEQLFSDALGVAFPLSSLQRWLRGLPGDTARQLQWDEQGHLYIFQEQGWRVEMTRYRKIEGFDLPQAFFLSRADQPELMVRLILRSWQLEARATLEP